MMDLNRNRQRKHAGNMLWNHASGFKCAVDVLVNYSIKGPPTKHVKNLWLKKSWVPLIFTDFHGNFYKFVNYHFADNFSQMTKKVDHSSRYYTHIWMNILNMKFSIRGWSFEQFTVKFLLYFNYIVFWHFVFDHYYSILFYLSVSRLIVLLVYVTFSLFILFYAIIMVGNSCVFVHKGRGGGGGPSWNKLSTWGLA